MSHHKNADYEIVRESSLHHSTEESMQSQIVQIVVNLIINDNASFMTLESTLFLFRQSVIVNSLSIKQTLIFHSHFDDHDNNFLKNIRVKKLTDYYNKFLCEHNE